MADQRPAQSYTMVTTATELDVRATVTSIRNWLSDLTVPPAKCGMIELTLAEALNNINEHAFAGLSPGPIEISARVKDGYLTVVTRDRGHPQRGGTLPEGRQPRVAGPRERLPEGGFGWYLIRALTASQNYCRIGDENRLELTFNLNRSQK